MSRNKARGRAKYRLTVKLDMIWDADLIAWLEDIPTGQRSIAVRDVLRGHINQGSTPAASNFDLRSIRSVVAEELDRALAGRHIGGMEAASQPVNDSEAEQKYGDKLDRLLGGLQARMQDDEGG